ncbi:MAG: hypothetical protein Q7T82_00530 [Armatimonadota bacterium]|nr:hypothetical protein [Armatimonadota bacterium]
MNGLTVAAVAALAVAAFPLISRLLRSPRLRKPNFREEIIPAAYGLYIAFYSVLGCVLVLLLGAAPTRVALTYAAAIGGMAALGLLDDAFGSREAGGFRGHFKKLLVERRITTGAVKAIGGGVLALAIGASVSRTWSGWIANSLLVALSANALNLLDLRPGRALGGFAFGMVAVAAVCGFDWAALWPLTLLLVLAIPLVPSDTEGRAMMGDTGSNALGAALGLTLAMSASPAARGAAIALLIGLHIFCERYSLSQIIERSAILKKIDSLLGVR